MRTIVPLGRTMQFPLNLAEGLRTTFADVGSSPFSERLAALARRLGADAPSANEAGESPDGSRQRIPRKSMGVLIAGGVGE
jgi:hypothetical protein